MVFADLEAGAVYWARRKNGPRGEVVIVQVSTVFGEQPEYWTLLTVGSEDHKMPDEFEIVCEIASPLRRPIRQAAE